MRNVPVPKRLPRNLTPTLMEEPMAIGSITSVVNLPIVRRLLLSMKISQETADRLGVSPDQLEDWLHSLAGQLDRLPAAPAPQSRPAAPACYAELSAEEMRFLLHGYESADAPRS